MLQRLEIHTPEIDLDQIKVMKIEVIYKFFTHIPYEILIYFSKNAHVA